MKYDCRNSEFKIILQSILCNINVWWHTSAPACKKNCPHATHLCQHATFYVKHVRQEYLVC